MRSNYTERSFQIFICLAFLYCLSVVMQHVNILTAALLQVRAATESVQVLPVVCSLRTDVHQQWHYVP
jgi:hypothetical protein